MESDDYARQKSPNKHRDANCNTDLKTTSVVKPITENKIDNSPHHIKYRYVFLETFLERGSFKAGFECTVCDNPNLYVYNVAKSAVYHVESVHTKEKPPAKRRKKSSTVCAICGKDIKNKKYSDHLKRYHPEETSHMKRAKVTKCLYCSKVFDHTKTRKAYIRHLEHHRKYPEIKKAKKPPGRIKCDICEKLIYALNIKAHREIHFKDQGPKYFCTECPKSFAVKKSYYRHQQIHKYGRKFKCDQCGKGFLQRAHLVNHMLSHSDDMPFDCSHCGQQFRLKHHLKAHINRKHDQNSTV